jgi:hypothetical protein
MKTKLIIVSLAVGAVLSGCSYSQQQKPLATRLKASVGRRPSGRRITYQGNGLVRVPEQTHVYKIGRLPDGDSMREAGNYYHIEQSAYWNRFARGGRPVVTNGAPQTSGPSETAAAKAYRIAPDDHELTELRNEARDDKEKAAQELAQAKLAREKLEGLTQGLAHTDQVIKEAQTRIAELETQNDELRRKAAVKESEKSPETDFSKIEGMSKGSKTEGLQPGPGSDD